MNAAASPQLARMAELEIRRREIEEELKLIEREQSELEPVVLEQFIEAGVSKVTIHGLTAYPHSQLWAGVARLDDEPSEAAYERACERLRELGLGDYVQTRFNVQSLSSFIREQKRAGELDVAQFAGAINVGEKVSLRFRKAA